MDEPIDIPRFDLAEEIMAEQRKVAATRRKGPGSTVRRPSWEKANAPKPEAPEPAVPVALVAPVTPAFEVEHVIAEIVARDIRQLCGGNVLGV